MSYRTAVDITVDAAGDPENVVASGFCRRVRVQQLITETLAQFFAYGPGQTTNGKRRFEGSEHIFENLNRIAFQPGETVGRLAMVAGSAQFTREEEW
jgi:hypothetical protein